MGTTNERDCVRPCACGCGQTPKRGNRYVRNHHRRRSRDPFYLDAYIEEDRGYTSPCRIWQRHIDKYGYAVASTPAGPRMALHLIYEREHGPLPAGHVLERLCGVRACVHPDHARPATRAELFNPDNAPTQIVRRTGICLHGHAMTPENTIVAKNGDRKCRTCFNLRQREYYARTKDPAWQAAREVRRRAEQRGSHEDA